MVEWSSQVKQMQSLWPQWMWHPEMCFTILSLNLSLSASFDVRLCLGHPWISQHCSFLFLPIFAFYSSFSFNVCFYLFHILFDPCVKPPLGWSRQSPCCYDWGLAAEWRWPLNFQALTVVFITSLGFSLISPYSLVSFPLWTSVSARAI